MGLQELRLDRPEDRSLTMYSRDENGRYYQLYRSWLIYLPRPDSNPMSATDLWFGYGPGRVLMVGGSEAELLDNIDKVVDEQIRQKEQQRGA